MLEHADLYDLLPHRHPIMLVDRVLDVRAGDWIETVKAISAGEPCFAGLGAGRPAHAFDYPPTLILESFVQSAGVLWAWTLRAAGEPHQGTLLFAGARDVLFHRDVQPGDVLRHRVELGRIVGSNAFVAGTTTVAATGEPVCQVGSLVLARRPSDRIEAAR
jgi:3-hydroxyacyl-[acyl-carrier-protein] dehydratase